MNSHDELELLSAYLDEELDASDRARLDVHIASCAECRSTLTGLQATLTDLRSLPEPAPTPQDSWALRAAIRRARSPMRRWQRLSWAAGAVAAGALAFAFSTLPGSTPALRESADSLAAGPPTVPIYQSGQNLSAVDAQARLLELAGYTARTLAGGSSATAETTAKDRAFGVVAPEAVLISPYAASADDHTAIEHCVNVVRGSTQEFLEPLRYELATFESKPAFLLFFRTTDRYELWVVGRSDCSVLYFSQAGG